MPPKHYPASKIFIYFVRQNAAKRSRIIGHCRTFAPVREIDLKARALLIRTQIIRHSGEGSLIQVIAVRAQSGLCKATETNTRTVLDNNDAYFLLAERVR